MRAKHLTGSALPWWQDQSGRVSDACPIDLLSSTGAPLDPASRNQWSESDRLDALRSYGILDTPPEPAFDEIVEIAALVCHAPVAVVNLVEDSRQFFKAEIGLGVRETPVDVSICAHAILQPDLFVVPDTTKDPRFSCNPLVVGEPYLRFYAGALLETPDGLPLGTVCVLDYEPRPEGLTSEQAKTLLSLARATMAQLELRRSNEALARSERRFRALAEATPQIVWSARPDGVRDYFNHRWRAFTGLTLQQSLGAGWQAAVHEEDRRRAGAAWDRSLANGDAHEVEYRLRSHEGEARWVVERALPVRNHHGEIERWFGTCTDVHDLKEAELGSARLAAIVSSSPDAVISFASGDGHITSWNKGAEAMFGYTASEAIGAPVNLLLPERDLTQLEDETGVFSAVMRHGSIQVESIRRHKKGHLLAVAITAARLTDRDGRALGVSAIFRDVTDRRRAEAELRDQLLLNRTITEHVAEALVLMDADGRVTFANPAAEQLFGWKADDLRGEVLHEVTHHHHPDGRPYPAAECPLVGALRTGKVLRDHEDVFFRRDGSTVPVMCSNAPIRSGDEIVGAVLAARDITERKRLEEQQALVGRELHHRVKNSLATVQAVISSTARHAQTVSEFRHAVTNRIASLGKTHTVLIESQYAGASLKDILLSELAPYDDLSGRRLKVDGPEVRLSSENAIALGMAFHELTTNCAKYGAFSLPSGCVQVRWRVEQQGGDKRLELTWDERDGPLVTPPARQGFGSTLLQRALGRQLGGDVEIVYAPEGLRVRIRAVVS